MLRRRKVLVAGAGGAPPRGLAGCSGDKPKKTGEAAGGAQGGGGGGAAQPAKLTFTPAADSKDVAPSSPVTVAIENGTLDTVTVAAAGKNLAGTLADDKHNWQSTGPLA